MNSIKNKKIYVIYTGGTIGMVRTAQGFIPDKNILGNHLDNLKHIYEENLPDFDLHQYENLIDSSNITPDDWITIASDIAKNYNFYDGFVVLHGTDTMAYTASSLSFMLENLGKPVIVTGSQISITEARSDAIDNILNSFILATNPHLHEVCLYFNKKLFRGNRSVKSNASGIDAFASPNYPVLARAEIDIEINSPFLLEMPPGEFIFRQQSTRTPKIVKISLFPGMDAVILHNILSLPIDGVIFKTYGTGNMMNSPEILHEIISASKKNIFMINCTQCFKGHVSMNTYATGLGQIDAPIFSGKDMTGEAALTKLMYLLRTTEFTQEDVVQKLCSNIRGEISL